MAFRSCIACRAVCEKTELLRLVLLENRVVVDKSAKHLGRGAYVHNRFACIRKSMEVKLLSHRFRCKGKTIDLSYLKDLLSSSVVE